MPWVTWLGYVVVCGSLRCALWPCLDEALGADGLHALGVLCVSAVHDGVAGALLLWVRSLDRSAPTGSGGTGSSIGTPLPGPACPVTRWA